MKDKGKKWWWFWCLTESGKIKSTLFLQLINLMIILPLYVRRPPIENTVSYKFKQPRETFFSDEQQKTDYVRLVMVESNIVEKEDTLLLMVLTLEIVFRSALSVGSILQGSSVSISISSSDILFSISSICALGPLLGC